MMRYLILAFSLFSSIALKSQFGIIAHYNSNDHPDWYELADEKVLSSGYEFGVDYWFRLNKKRIEFYPTLSYSKDETFNNADVGITAIELKNQSISLTLRTHFYLLDFGEDCDCPTFSKQGPGFGKGFFVHASPGIVYSISEGARLIESVYRETKTISPKLGLGFGFDIGFNDFFTITPIYTYNYIFSKEIEIESESSVDGILDTSENQHQFGLRLGFRFDYRNGRRR